MNVMPARPSFTAIVLVAACCAAANAQDAVEHDVSARLTEYMHAAAGAHAFSGAVIVVDGDAVLHASAHGYANREHEVPNTPAMKFRLGSITKQFTAFAVMLLQEQGTLSVEDPISRHLDDAPDAWREITIRHLLTHTSGIPSYTGFPEVMTKAIRTPASIDEVIATFRDMPLEFAPGERFNYSNSGYVMLGKIIENVAGSDYATFMRGHVFEPLGMLDTGYDRSNVILPGRASGYQRRGETIENAPYIDTIWPHAAGALYSTVHDMATWHRALVHRRLLSAESYDAMFTPFLDGYAYGWQIASRGERPVVEHGGGIHGFQARIVRLPEEELCVVVLSNVVPGSVGRIASDLVGVALGEDVSLPNTWEAVAVDIDPTTFDALAGRYEMPSGMVMTVRRDGDRFFVQLAGRPEREMWPRSETEFFLKVARARLVFTKDGEGKATHVTLHQGGREGKAARLGP